jgi:hypothetical protein
MISTPPLNIWAVPINAERIKWRPPLLQADAVHKMTHGMRPKALMMAGHIRQLNINPLKV